MNENNTNIYAVIDARIDGTGDIHLTQCATEEAAEQQALREWDSLTDREKAVRTITVAESLPNDGGEFDMGNYDDLRTLTAKTDEAVLRICAAVAETDGIELVYGREHCRLAGIVDIRVSDNEWLKRNSDEIIRERLGEVARELVEIGNDLENTEGIVSYEPSCDYE